MSYQAESWAWGQNIHRSHVKFVLLCLARHASVADDGLIVIAWPSAATIARKTGLDRKTVFTALQWLKENRKIAQHGNAGRTIVYRLACLPNGKGCPIYRPKNGTIIVPYSVSVDQSQKRDDTFPLNVPKTGR